MTGKIHSKKGNTERWLDDLLKRNPLEGPWDFPWYRRLDDRYHEAWGDGALGHWLLTLASKNETKHLERRVATGWETPRERKEMLAVVASLNSEPNANRLVLLTKPPALQPPASQLSSAQLPDTKSSNENIFILPNLCETRVCGRSLIKYLRTTRVIERVQVDSKSESILGELDFFG